MPKKKKISKSKKHDFNSDPFNHLKGFVVSDQEQEEQPSFSPEQSRKEVIGSFTDEMEMLGVRQLNKDIDLEDETPDKFLPAENSAEEIINQTDEELFLTAMGDLPVRFKDHLPENDPQPLAVPRRMKQLKQGKLTPDASLDLHGCQRTEVEEKLRYFLQNAQHQDWQTLLVITGKGLHSDAGKPILRDATEQFLSGEGRTIVAEWGRATKQYGGDGALIVFLRKNK